MSAYNIDEVRGFLSANILDLRDLEKEAGPPIVQEIVLARRAVEDARMRLGVAIGYQNGDDPFTVNLVKEEK